MIQEKPAEQSVEQPALNAEAEQIQLEREIAQEVGGVYTSSEDMSYLQKKIFGLKSAVNAALRGENAQTEGPVKAKELEDTISKYNIAARKHLESIRTRKKTEAGADVTIGRAAAEKTVQEKTEAAHAEVTSEDTEAIKLSEKDGFDLMADKMDLENKLKAAGLHTSSEMQIAAQAFKSAESIPGISQQAKKIAYAKYILVAQKFLLGNKQAA